MIRETVASKGGFKGTFFFESWPCLKTKGIKSPRLLYTLDTGKQSLVERRFEDTIAITEYTSLDEAPRYSEILPKLFDLSQGDIKR